VGAGTAQGAFRRLSAHPVGACLQAMALRLPPPASDHAEGAVVPPRFSAPCRGIVVERPLPQSLRLQAVSCQL